VLRPHCEVLPVAVTRAVLRRFDFLIFKHLPVFACIVPIDRRR
jgi:hypothetical protein